MAQEFYVLTANGTYLGSWPSGHANIPANSTEVGSAPPKRSNQVWLFPGWGDPTGIVDSKIRKSDVKTGTVSESFHVALNSVDAEHNYSEVCTVIVDNTDSSEDGKVIVKTSQAGALVTAYVVEQGITVGTATDGDQGLGTVNTTGLYINGIAVDNLLIGGNTF